MARIQAQRSKSAAPAADARRRLLTNRKRPAYQVVLEQVTQKYKKLITVGSFQTKPPEGYTFIPAGDPQITNRCKQLARLDGAKVYIVSTSKRRTDLSVQVHRIGYHFPNSVVERACVSLGVGLSSSGRVIHNQTGLSIGSGLEQALERRNVIDVRKTGILHPQASQASIDTQAREAIKDLFPKIPGKDLHDIVNRAFDKDQARVGTAPELTLPRRVQLAVVAHIRHNYTDYDKLLRHVPYHTARAMAEKPSLDKLAEWRGDDEDHPNAVEEILREVIVIPDDDEDEAGSLHEPLDDSSHGARQGSIENIPNATFGDEIETRAVDYGVNDGSRSRLNSIDSDEAGDVQFLGHGQYAIARQDRGDQREVQRIGAHRQRAWEQAQSRQRGEPELVPIASQRIRIYEPLGFSRKVLNPINESSLQSDGAHHPQAQRPVRETTQLTYLEKMTPIPVRSSEQESQIRRIEHPVQAQNQYGGHRNYRLVEETYPKLVEISDRRSNLVRGSDKIPGHRGSLEGKPGVNSNNGILKEVSLQQFPITHFQETHSNGVLPSIENSPRHQVKINSEHSPRQGLHFHTVDDDYPYAPMQPGPSEPSGSRILNPNSGPYSNQNPFKRRRVISQDEITQKHTEPYSAPSNSQKTILIPIEEYNHQGNELQWSTKTQSLRSIHPDTDYILRDRVSMQSLPHDYHAPVPLFVRAHDSGKLLRFEPEHSRHSQVLLSPGLSQSVSDSHTFQHFETPTVSTHQTVPYRPLNPSQDVTKTYRRDAPRLPYETSDAVRHDGQVMRQRRNLPLERFSQNINSTEEETSPRWREPPQSPGSDMDYPIREKLYAKNLHNDVKEKPFITAGREINHGFSAVPTYASARQSIQMQQPVERRILLEDHNHVHRNPSAAENVFESNSLMHLHHGQRMFDKYTGREVIILE